MRSLHVIRRRTPFLALPTALAAGQSELLHGSSPPAPLPLPIKPVRVCTCRACVSNSVYYLPCTILCTIRFLLTCTLCGDAIVYFKSRCRSGTLCMVRPATPPTPLHHLYCFTYVCGVTCMRGRARACKSISILSLCFNPATAATVTTGICIYIYYPLKDANG